MRIIAGRFKQRQLHTPLGMDTRPTLGRTRESLFSMLYGAFEEAKVLDLFAGTGALGIEALSRGAEYAVFCDKAKPAIKAIKKNIAMLKIEDETSVIAGDWTQALSRLRQDNMRFDLIFVDPPYKMDPNPVLKELIVCQTLSKHGIIILEHDVNQTIDIPDGLQVHHQRTYKDTAITFLKKEGEDENHPVSGQL